MTKVTFFCLYTIVSTGLKTGARRDEILPLKWEDLNIEEKQIIIKRTLIYDKNGFRFGTPKSDSSVKTIKNGDSLLQDLKE
jgi:integrase